MKRVLVAVALAAFWIWASICFGQTTPQVVTGAMSCATSVDGSVVGVLNPLNPPIVAAQFTGTLPAGNYFTVIAWYDAAGHVTLASPEVQTQLSGSGELVVSLPVSGRPNAAAGMNVYIAALSGAETLQGQSTGSGTFTQSVPLTNGAALPSTNTTVCAAVANDAGWPTGTGYSVDLTSPAGAELPGFPIQSQFLGPGGSINLGNGFPLYNGIVTYGTAIQARPYNHATQSISGPLSMTGYAITQVSKLGVGTSVPGWAIDVESGPINTSGGIIFNGGVGVTPGNCMIAGSDIYRTFGPLPCPGPPALYYQTVKVNGTSANQAAALNFSQRFAFTNGSGQTNVDLNALGSGNVVATETANPGSSTNCATYDGAGNITPAATACAPAPAKMTFTCPGGTIGSNTITSVSTGTAVNSTNVVAGSVFSGPIDPLLIYGWTTIGGTVNCTVANPSSSTLTYGALVWNYAIF